MNPLSSLPIQTSLPQYLQATAEQIFRCIEERKYCALLGPRFTGKTELLHFIGEALKQKSQACVHVNLYDVEATKQSDFFASLATTVAQQIKDIKGIALPLPAQGVTDSAAFRSFVNDGIACLERDLVLILDHLEGAPNDLVRALLTSLRAVYMEQREAEHQLVAIVAGALSLAGLATGETSPFRGIAERVMVDLPPDNESKTYAKNCFAEVNIQVSSAAWEFLIRAARGDRTLITKLCERCTLLVSEKPSKRLSIPLLDKVIQEFIVNDAQSHEPLREPLRLIEGDPDLLICTLLLAKKGIVHRGQLPLPLSPDIDPFYLTGIIRKVEPDSYQFRNEVYQQFLTQYFNPGRVGHILTMSGRWSQAIEYLEASVNKGDLQYRSDLFAATIHSMYASQTIEQAAEYLARGLSAGFKTKMCRVWYSTPGRKALKFVGGLGKTGKDKLAIGLETPISDERLEARAYRDVCTLRGQENNGNIEWAIPLSISDRPPIGVVYAVIHMPDWESARQREWELELTGYLHQAARAIQEVVMCQEWRNQLETLDRIALNVAEGLQVKQILRTALEKTVELVGGTGGGVYLLDNTSNTFTLEAQYGLSPSLEGSKINSDRGVVGEILQTKRPFSISDYKKWPNRQQVFDKYDLTAVVGVPILSGNRLLGVLAVHDQREGRAFQKEHEELLLRVGNHVAAALEHAKAYQSAKEAQDYRELLIHSSLDGIIAINNEGYVTEYNEGAARICGYTREEVFQQKLRVDILYGDLITAQTINRKLYEKRGKLENHETIIHAKNGDMVPIVLSATFLENEAGEHIGSVGYFKDLRPLKQVEGELRSVLDAISAVAKASELDNGLAALAEKMVIGLNVSFCLILLLDEEKQDLKVRAAYPVQRSDPLVWDPSVGDTLDLKGLPIIECLSKMEAPRAFRRGEVTNAENTIVDFIQETTALGSELQSILAIPFRTEQDLFGVCVLGEIRNWERNPFDENKKKSAISMTDAVTVLIDRLRAQETMRWRMTLAEELRKVSDAVAHLTTEAPKAVLDQIAQSVCKMVDADCGMIYPYYADLEIYDVRNIGSHGLLDVEKRFRPKPRMHHESMTRVVLQNNTPVIVDDTDTGVDRSGQVQIWAEENKFIKRERIRSFVGIGLWSGQEAVGALFVNFHNLRRVTDDELNTIRIFANQAAVAIQQSRLYQRGVKDHKVVLSTNKITQLIGSAEALHEVWQAILEGAMDVTGANRGRILARDRFGNLMPEVTLGFDEKSNARFQNYPYEPCPLVRWVMDNKEPLLISDMADDSHPKSLRECCIKFCPDVKSILTAPVLHSDAQNVLGILILESADWAAFSAYDKILMEAFVKYAGIAVQSAERITEIQQGAGLRAELLKAGQSILSLEKSQEVLQSIADRAKTALGCELVTLYTYDASRQEIGFPPTISGKLENLPALQTLGYVSKKSVVWKILRTSEPHFAVDSLYDKRMLSNATTRHKGFKSFVEREGIRSSAGIPLLIRDERVGIMFVNYRIPHPFPENERENILLFATQAAIAILNARMYEDIRKRENQLKALYDAAKVAGLDRKQLLDKILELAISITSARGEKATLGTIQILDEQTHEREFTNVYPPSEYAKLRAKIGHRLSLDKTKTKDGRIGITGRVANKRKPQLVSDVTKDPDYVVYSTDTKSELAVPLLDGNRVIGVLNVESDKIDAFDTSDKDALLALADLTITALRNQDHIRHLSRVNAVAMTATWGAELAHDVNREVRAIRWAVFSLQKRSDVPNDVKTVLEEIDSHANYLALPPFLARVPEAREAFELQDIPCLDDVISSEVESFRRVHTNITMKCSVNCSDTRIVMHEQWLRRILRHLIRNAIAAIPTKREKKVVIVRTCIKDEKVEIQVEDNGKGISENIRPILFEQPVAHNDGRLGLGLLIVRFLVEQHSGEVGFRGSRSGKGTCFFITLPRMKSPMLIEK